MSPSDPSVQSPVQIMLCTAPDMDVARALARHGLVGFRYDVVYSVVSMFLGVAIGVVPHLWMPDADAQAIALATLGVGAAICAPLGVWVLLKLRANC